MIGKSLMRERLIAMFAATVLALTLVQSLSASAGLATSERTADGEPYSLQVFLARFRVAFSQHDEKLVRDLFSWEGLNPSDREAITGLIEHDLGKRLLGLRVYTADQDQHENKVKNLNLVVVAQLVAKFVDGSGRIHHSLHQLGLKDGTFFIALARSIRPGAIII